jgi:flavin-binding protein dodecin
VRRTEVIHREIKIMAVARVTEITSSSKKGFEEAMENGIKRATKTLENITGAWLANQEVVIDGGKIKEYRVRMKLTFILLD